MSELESGQTTFAVDLWNRIPLEARELFTGLLRTVNVQAERLETLEEQVRLLRAQLYGRKSEKKTKGAGEPESSPSTDQPAFPLDKVAEQPSPSVVPVEQAKRPRRGGRRPLSPNLPRIEKMHDVEEMEKLCSCGAVKSGMGHESSEQADIIPAIALVLRNLRPKYVCRKCDGVYDIPVSGDVTDMAAKRRPTVTIAPAPPHIIPKCIASAGTLAHIVTAKFVDGTPLYRQEKQMHRLGLDISRSTMCGWLIKVSDACAELMKALRVELLRGPCINADETTVQVLREPGRKPTTKSYMWVFRGGTLEKPAIEYLYDETRGAEVPKVYLANYTGRVQTDGYAGYDFLDADEFSAIIHLGCWAHVRRKFKDVIKAARPSGRKGQGGIASEAVFRIGELYAIEHAADRAKMNYDERRDYRKAQATQFLDDFRTWLIEVQPKVPPKMLLGEAIGYALNEWPKLIRYLEEGYLRLDNNWVENAIRPFVLGRKNWLFSCTPAGAVASSRFYSLVETSKAAGIEPYWYLRAIFQRLPYAKTPDDYKSLLPQYIDKKLIEPEDFQGTHALARQFVSSL